MSKKGHEVNSPLSRTFRATAISLRGFRFRDLKSSTNRRIAAEQKENYLRTEILMTLARGEEINAAQRALLSEEI